MVRSAILAFDPAPHTRVVDGVEVVATYDAIAGEVATLHARAAVADRSHRGRLVLTGPDRVAFLHGQTSANVRRLGPGQGVLSTFLTGKGKMRGFGTIHAEPDALIIACDGAAAVALRSHLESFVIMDDVAIADAARDVVQLAVIGPQASAQLGVALGRTDLDTLGPFEHIRHVGNGPPLWVARDDSFELPAFAVVAAPTAAVELWQQLRSVLPAVGCDAVERLRIGAGFPRWELDVGDDTFPIEAGLARAIDFDKGCFTGYEVMARIRTYGHVNRHLVGLTIAPESAASEVAAGDAVKHQGVVVGRVTSVSRVADDTLALAMLATVATAPDTPAQVTTASGVVMALVRPLARAPLAG